MIADGGLSNERDDRLLPPGASGDEGWPMISCSAYCLLHSDGSKKAAGARWVRAPGLIERTLVGAMRIPCRNLTV